jgi:hypothetical protein
MRPTIGYDTLDLTPFGKGKPLEPVRVSVSPDKKAIIINQYTRGHPPTRIPIGGGTVNFDSRFGTQAKCGACNSEIINRPSSAREPIGRSTILQ